LEAGGEGWQKGWLDALPPSRRWNMDGNLFDTPLLRLTEAMQVIVHS
jgi:hypothetical protein